MGSGAAITAPALAREAKKEASLEGWREGGTRKAAAAAAGVAQGTISNWFRDDMAYKSAVQAAIEEFCAQSVQELHVGILEQARAAFRGDVVLTKQGIEGGKPVELHERVQIPPLARQLLTRGDPRYTHPKQEVEHTGAVTVSHAIADARKRMSAHAAALEGRVVPEAALEAPQEADSALEAPLDAPEGARTPQNGSEGA